MNDGVKGSIILAIGYAVAVLIVFIREKKKGRKLTRPAIVLFVIWMILCGAWVCSRWLKG